MENILKLNLKKDIFEKVKNDGFSGLSFETSPFYFSRFTTSKNNTVDDLKKDPSLFKKYDKVMFSCSGETCEYDVLNIGLNSDGTEFVLEFNNPEVEEKIEEKVDDEHVPNAEEVKEMVIEQGVDDYIEKAEELIKENTENNEEITEVEDTTLVPELPETDNVDVEDCLIDFYNSPNTYCVNNKRVVIGYLGRILGCDKRFISTNEHDVVLMLETKVFNTDKLDEELSKYVGKDFVFVYPDGVRIFEDTVEIPLKKVNMLEIYKWM